MNYIWKFPSLEVVYNQNSMLNVVTKVHWVLTANDGEYSDYAYGVVDVGPANPQSFTTYSDLTKNQVQSWVETLIGANNIQATKDKLAKRIASKKNPVGEVMLPPWEQEEIVQQN
jgi:hypothetical protein